MQRSVTGEALAKASARFWTKVSKDGKGGCWLWTASEDGKGYGQFAVANGDVRKAHRVALLLVGQDPTGRDVHHLCHVPLCVRPEHLEIIGKGDHSRLHATGLCKNGHPMTPDNTYSRGRKPSEAVCATCHRSRQAAYRARKAAGEVST